MFTFKKTSIYFLILLFLLGINLFKNIYIEHKVNNQLQEKGLTTVKSITCNGFLNIECRLKDISFDKNITNTNYTIKIKEGHLLDFNILQNNKEINEFKLVVRNMRLFDSRDVFLELNKPIDFNMTSISDNGVNHIKINAFRENLETEFIIDLQKNRTISQDFLLMDIKIKRNDDVIKKVIYELYKVKLLEIIESDDDKFSSTRGINIPLGIDTHKVIAQDIFLGEPYNAMSILLKSEFETFDWIIKYNNDSCITNFLSDVLIKNGVSQLQLKAKRKINE